MWYPAQNCLDWRSCIVPKYQGWISCKRIYSSFVIDATLADSGNTWQPQSIYSSFLIISSQISWYYAKTNDEMVIDTTTYLTQARPVAKNDVICQRRIWSWSTSYVAWLHEDWIFLEPSTSLTQNNFDAKNVLSFPRPNIQWSNMDAVNEEVFFLMALGQRSRKDL